VEEADSVVFNPHKWLGAQFDCSIHFIRDPESLVRTLAIRPEYLKTQGRDGVVNYSEWTVPLGRRFRALKLWFLLRAHGLEGLRGMIRSHVRWSEALASRLAAVPGFEIVTEPMLSLFTFRHQPCNDDEADEHNLALVDAINDDGRIYITQTRVEGRVALRFQVGQFATSEADVDAAFDVITSIAARLTAETA
jgi:aromatic-L-amino-acid decarboxylase